MHLVFLTFFHSMVRLVLATSALFIFLPKSYATIELISVEGASNFTGIGTNKVEGDPVAIYGGTAGSDCTNTDTNVTCDSCSINTAFNTACNETRIYNGLRLRIRFKSDSVTGNTAIGDSNGAVVAAMPVIDPQLGVGAGTEHTAIIDWGTICSGVLSLNSDCNGDASINITVGVDNNGNGTLDDTEDDDTSISITVQNTITAVAKACTNSTLSDTGGMCDFSVFPGDNKVFLQDLSAPSGFPNGDNLAADKLRFYFSAFAVGDTGTTLSKFQSITHNSGFFETEIDKEDDGTLKAKQDIFSDGIVNGDEYFFRMATVDLAGNIGYHTPDLRADNSAEFHTQNVHSAQPSPVTALLTEDLQCFIATAAFGTPFEKHVVTLRSFRDRFLKTNNWGRWFVKNYYTHSPTVAQFISQRPWLKLITRWILMPFIFFAQIGLSIGIFYSILIFLLGLFMAFIILRIINKFIKKKALI